MRLWWIFLLHPSISLSHETPSFLGQSAREAHALYHEVRSLPLVEPGIYTVVGKFRHLHFYYFDPKESILYPCVTSTEGDDTPFCFDWRTRAMQIKWTDRELNEANRLGLTPTDRESTNTVVLTTSPPFMQHTTYVFYVGSQRVVRCRGTLTAYTFDHIANGETVYFKSERPDDYTYGCDTRFPQ